MPWMAQLDGQAVLEGDAMHAKAILPQLLATTAKANHSCKLIDGVLLLGPFRCAAEPLNRLCQI